MYKELVNNEFATSFMLDNDISMYITNNVDYFNCQLQLPAECFETFINDYNISFTLKKDDSAVMTMLKRLTTNPTHII